MTILMEIIGNRVKRLDVSFFMHFSANSMGMVYTWNWCVVTF